MAASTRSFASALCALGLLGCTVEDSGVAGLTSFAVTMLSPTDLGSPQAPLADSARTVQVSVQGKDAMGNDDTTLSGELQVYTQYLGTLTPKRDGEIAPLKMTVTNGAGTATLGLPPAYGPTYLWIEDGGREGATFATGTSPTLWYREPYLDDVQRPLDEGAVDALYASPLNHKQVTIEASRHGENGRLVVTGVYAQGYTVSDVDCSTRPCTAGDYGHGYVFAFNRARAEDGGAVQQGDLIRWVSGGIGEFNGLTEFNFPRTDRFGTNDPTAIPEPVLIDKAWMMNITAMIDLERLESALVKVENVKICPTDQDYDKYGQWKVDVGLSCSHAMNIVSAGAIAGWDPKAHTGETLSAVVGTLRAVNLDSPFNVWIMYPRDAADIQP